MLKRCLIVTPALVALALALGTAPWAQADEPNVKHLQIAVYELREAKQDVRNVSNIPKGIKNELLGCLDDATDHIKKTIEAMGFKAEYLKGEDRTGLSDFQRMRHCIKELKEAREQLQIQKGVPDDLRDMGMKKINKCLRHAEEALDAIK
jgi:hypothetical protein